MLAQPGRGLILDPADKSLLTPTAIKGREEEIVDPEIRALEVNVLENLKALPQKLFGTLRTNVGRPSTGPSIKPITREGGRVVYRVLATIQGKQMKRIVTTIDEARLVAAQWSTAQASTLQVLPTRLSPDQLRAAEAFVFTLDRAGIPLEAGALFLVRNWKQPKKQVPIAEVIARYEDARRLKGTSESQISNVIRSTRRFFKGKTDLVQPTRLEIENWLQAACPDIGTAGNYNALLGDLSAFLSWCVTKELLETNECLGIERRKVTPPLPATLTPMQVRVLMSDMEENAPEWVPYYAVCLFGMVRPGTREGEAERLDAALRAGKKRIHQGGIEIDGKAYGNRIVPWDICGPLKEWLDAYPPVARLFPVDRATLAERQIQKIRQKYSLSQDVLRHTGISAACFQGRSFAEVAMAAGTSEAKIRTNYLGRWSVKETQELYSIRPSGTKAQSVAPN